MRVTDSYMTSSFLNNLHKNTANVQKYQDQLSSLKEVSRPSDDPMRVSQILDLNNSILQNGEYKTTIKDTIDFTNVQDSALSHASDSMSRIRTLIQQAANGTVNNEDRQIIKKEVEAEIHSLTDSLNTNFGGKYVFSGMNTTTKPFEVKIEDGEITGIQYSGTTEGKGNLSREIASGISIELKTDGRVLMNEQGTAEQPDNLGSFLADVLTALDTNDTKSLSGDLLEKADKQTENIITMRSETGSIFKRLESAKDRNETNNLNLESIRSDKQDIDLAEKFMQYTMEKTAYQASLAIGTQILSTNILDYL